jgi:UDP-N-acetylmuramate dehydrogenase
MKPIYADQITTLGEKFADRMQDDVSLAPYTSARIGGKADVLITVDSADELAEVGLALWDVNIPFIILGGGSNVLVSDAGVREVVILNRARKVQFELEGDPPTVLVESGANFGLVSRQAGARGYSGLEWAAGLPGTVGGAVVGNAGAHGSDVAHDLMMAEILHSNGQRLELSSKDLEYGYRTSILKEGRLNGIVLRARFRLMSDDPKMIEMRVDAFREYRRKTQPPGASLGSMFKNPEDDFAGRLIEAAGLKGTKIGGVEVSTKHANFFISQEDATASDIKMLIDLVQKEVLNNSGVELELEIQLIGDW